MSAVKRVKLQYHTSIVIMTFCALVMLLGPVLVDGYLWGVMLLPFIIQAGLFYQCRTVLRDIEAVAKEV